MVTFRSSNRALEGKHLMGYKEEKKGGRNKDNVSRQLGRKVF